MSSWLDTKESDLYVQRMRNSEQSTSRQDREQARATLRDSVAPGVLLVAASAIGTAAPGQGLTPGNLLWAGLTLAAVALLVRSEVRGLRRADEYQRRLQLEALAVGFAAVLVLLVIGGVVVGTGLGEARPWLTVAMVGGVLAWLGARALIARRAR